MPWYLVIKKFENMDFLDFVKADNEKEAIIKLYSVADSVETTKSTKCDFKVSEVKLENTSYWKAKF